jgi:hypothetical protein
VDDIADDVVNESADDVVEEHQGDGRHAEGENQSVDKMMLIKKRAWRHTPKTGRW